MGAVLGVVVSFAIYAFSASVIPFPQSNPPLAYLVVIVALLSGQAVGMAVYAGATREWPPPPVIDPETRCRKCGYILRGITEPRCPECGEQI
jgi:hypothetical protein